MYAWMAKHRQQDLTCGHLHVKETEAWGCLDEQTCPQDWKLHLICLSDADMGNRREVTEVIGWMTALGLYAALFVVGIGGIASGVLKSDLSNVFIGMMFIAGGGIPGYGVLLKVIDDIRWLPVMRRNSKAAGVPSC